MDDNEKSQFISKIMQLKIRTSIRYDLAINEVLNSSGQVIYKQKFYPPIIWKGVEGVRDFDLNLYSLPLELTWELVNIAAKDHTQIDDYSYPYTISDAIETAFTDDFVKIWQMTPNSAKAFLLDILCSAYQQALLARYNNNPEKE